ncbi:MAG: DNA polymerase III subunit beta [Acidimicrobiia bacterium]
MRIRAERDDLADVFARVNRAVGTRGALPILQGVLCEVRGAILRVTGTDLEMTVRITMEVEVLEEGRVVIPARLAGEAIRKMPPGTVTLGAMDGDVEIIGKGPRFSLRPLAVDDFPELADAVGEGVDVDGEALVEALTQVTVAASGDTARPILTGVLFEGTDQGLRLVATDSYRLAVRDLPGVELPGAGLVPARGLREVARTIGAAKVRVGVHDREAVFSSDRGTLTLRLIEGIFPKYRSLIPEQYPGRVRVEREALLDALGRAGLVAEDHIPVRLRLMEGGVEVTVTRQDVGAESEHLPGEYDGSEGEVLIAFNPRYLADGVSVINTERVEIQVVDGLKPSIIKGVGDDGFLYLLMPVRI